MRQLSYRIRRRQLAPRPRPRPRWVRPAQLAAGGLLVVAGLAVGVRQLVETGLFATARERVRDEMVAGSVAVGLVVRELVAEGRRRTTEGEIVQALARYRGMPLLAVDLAIVQQRLEQLPWVRTATVRRELPDTLAVRITEHRPVAIWHHGDRRRLLGSDGEVIPVRDLRSFASLPVIAGAAAPERIGALLTALAYEPELARRVRRAALVGGRRWTVWLEPQIEVRLPEYELEEAWRYLAARQREDAILARAVDLIDLRRRDWLVVRTAAEPSGPRSPAGQGA